MYAVGSACLNGVPMMTCVKQVSNDMIDLCKRGGTDNMGSMKERGREVRNTTRDVTSISYGVRETE